LMSTSILCYHEDTLKAIKPLLGTEALSNAKGVLLHIISLL
jgi:hypothetical protein